MLKSITDDALECLNGMLKDSEIEKPVITLAVGEVVLEGLDEAEIGIGVYEKANIADEETCFVSGLELYIDPNVEPYIAGKVLHYDSERKFYLV